MPSVGTLVGPLLDLDEQPAAGIGLGGAGDAAVQTVQGDGAAAAGKTDGVGHLGDGADARVLALVLGDEQDAALVADVDRQRHVHVREDDDVVEWNEQELAHGLLQLLGVS